MNMYFILCSLQYLGWGILGLDCGGFNGMVKNFDKEHERTLCNRLLEVTIVSSTAYLSIKSFELVSDAQPLFIAASRQHLDDGLLVCAEALHSLPQDRGILTRVERVHGNYRRLRLQTVMKSAKLRGV